MESKYMENDCTYKNETNYKAQWSVQNQVNNWWDTRNLVANAMVTLMGVVATSP